MGRWVGCVERVVPRMQWVAVWFLGRARDASWLACSDPGLGNAAPPKHMCCFDKRMLLRSDRAHDCTLRYGATRAGSHYPAGTPTVASGPGGTTPARPPKSALPAAAGGKAAPRWQRLSRAAHPQVQQREGPPPSIMSPDCRRHHCRAALPLAAGRTAVGSACALPLHTEARWAALLGPALPLPPCPSLQLTAGRQLQQQREARARQPTGEQQQQQPRQPSRSAGLAWYWDAETEEMVRGDALTLLGMPGRGRAGSKA